MSPATPLLSSIAHNHWILLSHLHRSRQLAQELFSPAASRSTLESKPSSIPISAIHLLCIEHTNSKQLQLYFHYLEAHIHIYRLIQTHPLACFSTHFVISTNSSSRAISRAVDPALFLACTSIKGDFNNSETIFE